MVVWCVLLTACICMHLQYIYGMAELLQTSSGSNEIILGQTLQGAVAWSIPSYFPHPLRYIKVNLMKQQIPDQVTSQVRLIIKSLSRAGVSNTRPAGRMRPANLFYAARGHVHEFLKKR